METNFRGTVVCFGEEGSVARKSANKLVSQKNKGKKTNSNNNKK